MTLTDVLSGNSTEHYVSMGHINTTKPSHAPLFSIFFKATRSIRGLGDGEPGHEVSLIEPGFGPLASAQYARAKAPNKAASIVGTLLLR